MTVDEMLRRMSSREFSEWIALDVQASRQAKLAEVNQLSGRLRTAFAGLNKKG